MSKIESQRLATAYRIYGDTHNRRFKWMYRRKLRVARNHAIWALERDSLNTQDMREADRLIAQIDADLCRQGK